jgi:hypothetical protein
MIDAPTPHGFPHALIAVIAALNKRLALLDRLPWNGDRLVVVHGVAVVLRPRWHAMWEYWGVEVVTPGRTRHTFH